MAAKQLAATPPSEDPPSCASCPCWEVRPHLMGHGKFRKGHCRRYPPGASGAIAPGQFALTQAGDVCFEHPDMAALLRPGAKAEAEAASE